jgi:hypothetical protein
MVFENQEINGLLMFELEAWEPMCTIVQIAGKKSSPFRLGKKRRKRTSDYLVIAFGTQVTLGSHPRRQTSGISFEERGNGPGLNEH